MSLTVGSVCSGIEAASIAWKPLDMKFEWFSEIASFPSRLLKEKYPSIPNIGDMNEIPDAIFQERILAPDVICGGTPCQAFSLAGWKHGLKDDRGNLTLKFVDIINASDFIRHKNNKDSTIVFWENVEGVLKDKTNAFGCFISSLAGLSYTFEMKKWPNAGLLRGPKRNVAWRVLDAKYFGLPQQRKRLYLLAGGKNFKPETVLFEKYINELSKYPKTALEFDKEGIKYEVFREYTDCLYSAYGTKWNGNAAATNGSLFVVQNKRIRRLSPLECERLMGFPDDYTNLPNAKKTNRYQALGNSWAVPVVKWIGMRLLNNKENVFYINDNELILHGVLSILKDGSKFYNFKNGIEYVDDASRINCTNIPENSSFKTMEEIVSFNNDETIYISPVGCYGIIRRKNERNSTINKKLEEVLLSISSEMTKDEIDKKSRVQKRGHFSNDKQTNKINMTLRKSLDEEYRDISIQFSIFDFPSVEV
ncbi:MAG: DNA cytosine methyltransferase [Oscillospiraceae bacterium]|jgi:DNA (cytosine-5)-methyltransferase 1|nr:DNA cytosine methyltransferase [Oscillospiraceae bacterium]